MLKRVSIICTEVNPTAMSEASTKLREAGRAIEWVVSSDTKSSDMDRLVEARAYNPRMTIGLIVAGPRYDRLVDGDKEAFSDLRSPLARIERVYLNGLAPQAIRGALFATHGEVVRCAQDSDIPEDLPSERVKTAIVAASGLPGEIPRATTGLILDSPHGSLIDDVLGEIDLLFGDREYFLVVSAQTVQDGVELANLIHGWRDRPSVPAPSEADQPTPTAAGVPVAASEAPGPADAPTTPADAPTPQQPEATESENVEERNAGTENSGPSGDAPAVPAESSQA